MPGGAGHLRKTCTCSQFCCEPKCALKKPFLKHHGDFYYKTLLPSGYVSEVEGLSQMLILR